MRPTGPRVGDKWKQMKDKGETSEDQPDPEWETSGRQMKEKTGDKEGKSCDQPDPEWETSGRQMRKSCDQPDPEWETSGRQMKDKWETSEGNHATNQTQSGRQAGDK